MSDILIQHSPTNITLHSWTRNVSSYYLHYSVLFSENHSFSIPLMCLVVIVGSGFWNSVVQLIQLSALWLNCILRNGKCEIVQHVQHKSLLSVPLWLKCGCTEVYAGMCQVSLIYKKWCQDLFTHTPFIFQHFLCMSSSVNNHLKRSISYSVIPFNAESTLSNVPSTVDSTSWSAPPEEYLLQNMT